MPLDQATYEWKSALAEIRQVAVRNLDIVPPLLNRWGDKQANAEFQSARNNLYYLDHHRLNKTFEQAQVDPEYVRLDSTERASQDRFIAQIDNVIEKCGARELEQQAFALEAFKKFFQKQAQKINTVPTPLALPPADPLIAAHAQNTRPVQNMQSSQPSSMPPGQYSQYQMPRAVGNQPNTPGAQRPGRK
ncbi:hypothetical protein [Streptomyces axinellae]|uniref:Uncharacterized protein n=1 Tax=Streptomyces axinellae TaxID=552788 RepID=A0ABP6CZN0_9ACTN